MPEPRVCSLVWDLRRGGTEGQCARVAMALAGRGQTHRVAVFRRAGFFTEAVEAACGPVRLLDIHHRFSFRTLAEIRSFARGLRTERIDLLHAWDADAAIFGRFAARLAGIPLITSRRDLGEIYPPWKVRSLAAADRAAARIVANAQAIADHLRLPADKTRVLPNVLDLAEFDRLARREAPWQRPGPAPVLVLVGRLDPEKDVENFLQALALMRETPWTAVVAGEGSERGRLQSLAAGLGLGDRVVFLGDTPEIPALLGQADLGLLCPRRNEGLSNALLEMMAAGLPCVATDCGGNREIVEDGVTGAVVPPSDPTALADALRDMLALPDRGRAMGAEGRRRVANRHDPARVADAFADLYQGLFRN